MKILLINKFLYRRGGSETYNFALAEALEAKGHEVIYFAMQDEKNIETKYSKYFVSNVDYNNGYSLVSKINAVASFFYSKEAARKIEELIIAEKPDIAHIGLIHRQLTFSVVDVLKKYNIPMVMTMHDLIFACPNYTMLSHGENCERCVSGSSMNCLRRRCVKDSAPKSLLAALEKDYLIKKGFYNDIDLYITECEMYKELFIKSKVTKSEIICKTNFLPVNQEYLFNDDYKDYVLYFGRFTKEKGIITLLDAHQKLNCKHKLILIGAGPFEEEIRRYIDNHSITNVEMPGAVYGQEMEKIIEGAKVIIMPSEWYENCPYALLQSMAKGKIVIASNIGGLPELVSNGDTGYLFEPADSDSLVRALKQVMGMPNEEYIAMSNHIVEVTRIRHHWEQYADFIISRYEELIKEKRGLR
ncbi:MAG: glycosyltransferase family 4 protein [Oscillospiraceae bacterium]|nr:glycosyltransferase family 4 protein [Oscillospiraceae bacterium]